VSDGGHVDDGRIPGTGAVTSVASSSLSAAPVTGTAAEHSPTVLVTRTDSSAQFRR
jgi:hypothetical protein